MSLIVFDYFCIVVGFGKSGMFLVCYLVCCGLFFVVVDI